MELTQTSIKQRFFHSSVFAGASSIFVWTSQYLLEQKVDQILSSSWVDFAQTLATSFINQSAYNALKWKIHEYTFLSEEKIIALSILIVSTLGVWAPKYIVHQIAHTKWAEAIAILYLLANIVTMFLYEKAVLQPKK